MATLHRVAKMAENVVMDSKHIVLRGVPIAATPGDLKRALYQAEVRGIAKVQLYYKHFRPTGKAILTLTLPDYARDAVQRLQSSRILGVQVEATPLHSPEKMGVGQSKNDPERTWELKANGEGPSAGVSAGRTVSIYGTPGRLPVSGIQTMVEGYKLARNKGHPPIQAVPLPERKFSMVTRFCVHLASESEAHRMVREFHMKRYKDNEDAPLMKVEIIY